MNKNLLIIIISSLIGLLAGYILFAVDDEMDAQKKRNATVSGMGETKQGIDFSAVSIDESRFSALESEMYDMRLQLQQVQQNLSQLSASDDSNAAMDAAVTGPKNMPLGMFNQRLYNIDNLIRGGIDPAVAEDIVRRKNAVELRRLELQDQATRNDYLNTQRYFDELELINQSDIDLRDELGDERYDKYLFDSKQNNRIRINAVMLDSPAEQAGIEQGDIVLSYDNQRMFSWRELKAATAEGELGEYVSITIYRSGEIFSFTVPRGTLGVQLGASRLAP